MDKQTEDNRSHQIHDQCPEKHTDRRIFKHKHIQIYTQTYAVTKAKIQTDRHRLTLGQTESQRVRGLAPQHIKNVYQTWRQRVASPPPPSPPLLAFSLTLSSPSPSPLPLHSALVIKKDLTSNSFTVHSRPRCPATAAAPGSKLCWLMARPLPGFILPCCVARFHQSVLCCRDALACPLLC